MFNTNDTSIICIDIQDKLVNMLKNGENIASAAVKLLKAASILDIDTIITEQYPKGLGKTIKEIEPAEKFKTVEKKEDFHDKEIDETKKEIKHKEHQIEIFQEIYNQSYKLNYKLTKKLEKENIYCKIYDEQYQKYNEIYNNSINKMQRQEDKLNELKNYFKKFKIINNSLITDKVKKINKLEYEIVVIKNNVTNYQERLEKLLEKILEFQKMVDLYKNGYNVRKNEYNFIRKIFLKEYYKMFEIYHIFKVDDFEQILEEFKLIKKKI
jgi:hypothetical protein